MQTGWGMGPIVLLLSHKAAPDGKDYFAGNPYNFFILTEFSALWAKKW